MKKFVLAVAIAMAGAWGIYQANQNNNQLSDLQMENVELLAYGELPAGTPYPCQDSYGGCIYKGTFYLTIKTWTGW